MGNDPNTQVAVTETSAAMVAITERMNALIPNLKVPLDITVGHLTRRAAELRLTADHVELVVDIRQEYEGSIAHVLKLIEEGSSPEEVARLYEIRERVCSELGKDGRGNTIMFNAPNFPNLLSLCATFPEFELRDETVAEAIAEGLTEARKLMPFVKFTSTLIDILCQAAAQYQEVSFQAVLEKIESRELAIDLFGQDDISTD